MKWKLKTHTASGVPVQLESRLTFECKVKPKPMQPQFPSGTDEDEPNGDAIYFRAADVCPPRYMKTFTAICTEYLCNEVAIRAEGYCSKDLSLIFNISFISDSE